VIEEPVLTGQPPPPSQAIAVLSQAVAVVMNDTADGPPVQHRSMLQAAAAAATDDDDDDDDSPFYEHPTIDHSGQPCGCGCGKLLQRGYYSTCFWCDDKDPAIAWNKVAKGCFPLFSLGLHRDSKTHKRLLDEYLKISTHLVLRGSYYNDKELEKKVRELQKKERELQKKDEEIEELKQELARRS